MTSSTVVAPARAPRRRAAGAALLFARLVGWTILVAVVAVVLVHILVSLLPTDAATVIAGPGADPERVERLRGELGLDDPVVVQIVQWLGAAARGDVGTSLVSGRPVLGLLGERSVVTAAIVIPAWLLAVLLGTVAVLLVAVRATPRTRLVQTVAGTLCGIPDAIIATVLVLVLATWLGLVPPVSLTSPGTSILEEPVLLVLPIAALVLPASAWLVRTLRGPAEDIAARRYVTEARQRGRGVISVSLGHVLPPLLPALAQSAAMLAGGIIAGSVVVEQIVALPGLGGLLAQAVAARDVPVVQAVAVIVATVTAAGLACADAMCSRLERQW
ncbi:hypothetical protein BHE97_04895 [Aeromicrobium sp. PE09-221]|uniref:ABC transporter permease n=1 Tax=Aeromicrobium sp. PE09-221 TaxID=1898043 RepID=UPI000B68ADF2|nr:ABC transporter permease [Aeromicrobium sp. PE09-221]OUZ11191.1 hypothetical protein BHE97_04895 [Aeromicrobium sp. PE09-221]